MVKEEDVNIVSEDRDRFKYSSARHVHEQDHNVDISLTKGPAKAILTVRVSIIIVALVTCSFNIPPSSDLG